jgi:hypothetical protein
MDDNYWEISIKANVTAFSGLRSRTGIEENGSFMRSPSFSPNIMNKGMNKTPKNDKYVLF